jgi:uncharacterized protein (DUF427 family)
MSAKVIFGEGAMKTKEISEKKESVWDYPRPPRVEPVEERVTIKYNGIMIADTRESLRVVETGGAPVYYLPIKDIKTGYLKESGHTTVCEWKGLANYYHVEADDRRVGNAGWTYHHPAPGYEAIKDYIAFYAWAMDECRVGEEIARPQPPGRFYGGWVTEGIVGPFKGEPGAKE